MSIAALSGGPAVISSVLSVFVCTCVSALFEVHSFPLPGASAQVLLANTDTDKNAGVIVLDGLQLTVYQSAAGYTPIVIALPDGTSAYDIADLDGDGSKEVLAVAGYHILRCPIDAGAARPPA
jgi:hypothetical protein